MPIQPSELLASKTLQRSDFRDGNIPVWSELRKAFIPQSLVIGSGDMLKATYDPDNDGIIDIAQLSGVAAASHTHAQSDVTNLVTDLAGKAATSHTHAVSDLTQSGATSNQVLTWNGSAWAPATASAGAITVLEGLATANVTITTANTFYSPTGASLSLTTGSWIIWAQVVMGRTANTASTYTGRIRDTTNSITLAEGAQYMASVANHYFTMNLVGIKVVPSGTTTVRVEGTANQGTSCVIRSSVATNGTGTNVTTKIYALKFG
jgi:hypothetical protein